MAGQVANMYRAFSAKTAAYQIVVDDIGKVFTNRGASGAVTLTLPVTSTIPTGWWCEVFVVADQDVTVASSGSADDIVTFNDAGADSVAFSTSSEKIGAGAMLMWDGTSWLCKLNVNETQTPVIA